MTSAVAARNSAWSARGLITACALLLSGIWSGWHLTRAFHRLHYAYLCPLICEPYAPVEVVHLIRPDLDWRSPLMIALLPWMVWSMGKLLRALLTRARFSAGPVSTGGNGY